MRAINEVGRILISSLVAICVFLVPCTVNATFSIVAVDPETGAVGGAGASCIAGSKMINDLIEGVGGVHTQAYYLVANQNNAHALLAAGLTPDSIISWLVNNDVQGMSFYRQYGVVTLAGPGSSAGFTGAATDYYKGHKIGPGYAIQGNILLGAEILDNMETAFLSTAGPLEDKLMAALEAANVPGADTRCTGCAKPAISAFIRVLHIGDGGNPFLWEYVDNTVCAANPIDTLLVQYNAWKALHYADASLSTVIADPSHLPALGIDSSVIVVTPRNLNGDLIAPGAEISISHTGHGQLSAVTDHGDGTYSAYVKAATSWELDTISVTVTAYGLPVALEARPIIHYFLCGDADGSGALNILDVSRIISYLYKNGAAPVPPEAGDADGSGSTNILDVSRLIGYLYKNGSAPICP